jgi:hypothetical protein
LTHACGAVNMLHRDQPLHFEIVYGISDNARAWVRQR